MECNNCGPLRVRKNWSIKEAKIAASRHLQCRGEACRSVTVKVVDEYVLSTYPTSETRSNVQLEKNGKTVNSEFNLTHKTRFDLNYDDFEQPENYWK